MDSFRILSGFNNTKWQCCWFVHQLDIIPIPDLNYLKAVSRFLLLFHSFGILSSFFQVSFRNSLQTVEIFLVVFFNVRVYLISFLGSLRLPLRFFKSCMGPSKDSLIVKIWTESIWGQVRSSNQLKCIKSAGFHAINELFLGPFLIQFFSSI